MTTRTWPGDRLVANRPHRAYGFCPHHHRSRCRCRTRLRTAQYVRTRQVATLQAHTESVLADGHTSSEMIDGFTAAQRQAITAGEGPLAIIAGPGCGKTTVLAARIEHLVRQCGADPSTILVVTFTAEAA